jgi:hypothetical protein
MDCPAGGDMIENSSPANPGRSSRIIPLPYALYRSNDLLFELYQGGQPLKPHNIQWIRFGHPQPKEERGTTRGED